MTHDFHPTSLREYDIRGVVGETLTEKDAYAIGRMEAHLAAFPKLVESIEASSTLPELAKV